MSMQRISEFIYFVKRILKFFLSDSRVFIRRYSSFFPKREALKIGLSAEIGFFILLVTRYLRLIPLSITFLEKKKESKPP